MGSRDAAVYTVMTRLIQFALHPMKFSDFAIGKIPLYHNRTFFMLCGWCDTGNCNLFNNTSPNIDSPI